MDPKMYFAAARRASGLTIDEAAKVCGASHPTYNSRERNPMCFSLEELCRLYASLDEVEQELLMRGIDGTMSGTVSDTKPQVPVNASSDV